MKLQGKTLSKLHFDYQNSSVVLEVINEGSGEIETHEFSNVEYFHYENTMLLSKEIASSISLKKFEASGIEYDFKLLFM